MGAFYIIFIYTFFGFSFGQLDKGKIVFDSKRSRNWYRGLYTKSGHCLVNVYCLIKINKSIWMVSGY